MPDENAARIMIFQLHSIIANRTFLNEIARKRRVANIARYSLYPQVFSYWDLLLPAISIFCWMLKMIPVKFVLPRNFIGRWLFPWLNEDARHFYGIGSAILLTLFYVQLWAASLPMSNKLTYVAGGNWEVYTPKIRILVNRLVCHVTYRASDAQFSSWNQSLNCTPSADGELESDLLNHLGRQTELINLQYPTS